MPEPVNLARRRPFPKKTFQLIGVGAEGRVWKVNSRGKRKPIAVKTYDPRMDRVRIQQDFIARQLAWLLFPKNFPKPYALNMDRKRARLTQQFRAPNKELEDWQNLLINTNRGETAEELRAYQRHSNVGTDKATHQLQKIREAGLFPDSHASNLGFLNPDQPIVYDLRRFNYARVRSYTLQQSLPARKRRKILKLLEEYRQMETPPILV